MFVSTSNSAAFLSAWLDASSVRAAREVQAGFTYEAELVSPLEQPTLDQFERSLGLAFAGDANGVSQRTVQRGGRNIQVYNASVQYGDLQPKPADVVLLAGKQGVTFVAGVHEALDVESALDQPTPRPERGRSWFMPERRPWFGARVRYDEVFGVRSQLLDTLSLLRRVAPEHLVLTELVKLDEAEQPNDDEAAGLEFWTLGWSERGSIAVEAQMTLEKAQ
jgi:hypothetical protein